MTDQAKPTFPHRHNKDGVIDSICSECLLTVASVRVERELAQHEDAHVCSQLRLHLLGADPFRRSLIGHSHDAL
jgi:hypothetical protein